MAPAPYEHRLRVRYAETDQMGVAHHASYVVWLEEARTRMLDDAGCSYRALERGGHGLVVRKLELRYHSPALYEEELVIATRVERVGAASIEIAYEVRRAADGEPLATGRTELCCIDLGAVPRKPRVLPAELRASLCALAGGETGT